MKRIRTGKLIGLAVAAAFAVPLGAAAQTVLPQYPQANDAGSTLITEERAKQAAPYYEQTQPAQKAETAQAAQKAQPAQSAAAGAPTPDLVVVTITPLTQPVINERQRREATFRALDSNSDGDISMAEAGVNTQLLNAYQRLDRDGNGILDRQEFASVHVDGSQKSGSSASRQARSQSGASAAAGGSRDEAGALDRNPSSRLPSRSIEERAIGSYPGESIPPNTPGQPSR